ncbi:hypothetical protein Tco_0275829 [Tanacetum coccineum]
MTNGREDTPPLSFLTLTPLPGPNVGELPPITDFTFTTKSPENTPLTNRASTLGNPNPMISTAFVEAKNEVLKSILRDRKRQVHNEDLRTKLDYYGGEYDEEREMELRPVYAPNMNGSRVERESDGRRPLERRVEEGGSRRGNLPPPLAAHLGRSENEQPLDSIACVTPFVCWIEDYLVLDGLKVISHVGSYDGMGDPDNYLHFFEGVIRDTLQILGLHEEQHISGFVHSKGKKKNRDRFSPYKGFNHGLLANLSKSQREILATENVAKTFEQPPCMVENRQSSDMSRSNSPYNLLLGRTFMQKMEIVMSTIHATIKFQPPCGNDTLFSTYEPNKVEEGQNKVKETVPEAMKDVLSCVDLIPRTITVGGKPFNMEHKLNEYKHIKPVKQKKRGLALKRNEAAWKEVDELTKAGILQEVKYQT